MLKTPPTELETRPPLTINAVAGPWEVVQPRKPVAKPKGRKRPSLKDVNAWMAKTRVARHKLDAANTQKHLGTPAY